MWYYNREEFTEQMIGEAIGFVYIIKVTINGEPKFYIGKKNFYSNRKVKLGKREEELRTDKRTKTYKVVRKLDYQNYHSSNHVLKQAYKDGIPMKRAILKLCYSKLDLTYYETKYLFSMNALESETYLNDNILGKFFKRHEKV
jgi:hypothetical protein